MAEPEAIPIRLQQAGGHQLFRHRLGPQRPQKLRIYAETGYRGHLQQVPPSWPQAAGPVPDHYPHNIRQRRVLA